MLGHSITYRRSWAAGRAQGIYPADISPHEQESFGDAVGELASSGLNAGVAAEAHERQTLKRLWRYIAPPTLSEERLSASNSGKVCHRLKPKVALFFSSSTSTGGRNRSIIFFSVAGSLTLPGEIRLRREKPLPSSTSASATVTNGKAN